MFLRCVFKNITLFHCRNYLQCTPCSFPMFLTLECIQKSTRIDILQTKEDITMIFNSYIAGACSGDTLKRKLSSVGYFLKLFQNLTVTHNYGTDYRWSIFNSYLFAIVTDESLGLLQNTLVLYSSF